ncbi:GT2 family glycosyltransferase [Nocardioides luteus]|uniref:Glycosyl transferase family 2 n=1 Tax=Nocardioides luteus TaxID=1844 RepID=A0ABQ5SV00_9ACTN|nr:glycosyltransferase family 2 protein [Nocardioides luteus]MDR7309256.1 GT2 family glycosyltransferase [Nocardioides luteus]GGR48743.1 glycosyl transferase family 2 [Nocardioides luteus]GLJ67661.1 glycosyl transferase family 2 [Nocardioides luteus]
MSRVRSIAVVVVTYNSAHLVADLAATLPVALAGFESELVVADNASTDATVFAVRRLLPSARIVEMGRNAGYAAGINAGIAAATPGFDAVLVLNPDVRLEPGCIDALAAEVGADVGVTVPRLVDGEGRLIESMRGAPSLLGALADAVVGARRAGRVRWIGEVVTDPAEYERRQDTDWAEGSTQLISAECWAACGPWDESFFLYSEETEFHLRARDRGFRVRYVPSARAVHLGGESTTSPGLWSLLVANRVKLVAARRGQAWAAAYWLVVLARESSRALLGRATSRRAVRTLVSPRRMSAPRGPEWVASA